MKLHQTFVKVFSMTPETWIERCYQQYLRRGITNKHKARLWAESTFHRLGNDVTQDPEHAADDDYDSW